MDEKNKKIFRSRISVLFIMFLSLPCTIPLSPFGIAVQVLCVMTNVLFVFMLLPRTMFYVISNDTLFVRWLGIDLESMKIRDIVAVERSYRIIGGHAYSLKTLEVRSERGAQNSFVLISPVREHEFLEELKTINPQIAFNVPIREEKWRIWDWDV